MPPEFNSSPKSLFACGNSQAYMSMTSSSSLLLEERPDWLRDGPEFTFTRMAFLPVRACSNMALILTTKPPQMAAPKLSTENPGNKAATNPKIAAFTTNKPSPIVRMMNGRENKTRMGLRTLLKTPMSAAAKNSQVLLS